MTDWEYIKDEFSRILERNDHEAVYACTQQNAYEEIELPDGRKGKSLRQPTLTGQSKSSDAYWQVAKIAGRSLTPEALSAVGIPGDVMAVDCESNRWTLAVLRRPNIASPLMEFGCDQPGAEIEDIVLESKALANTLARHAASKGKQGGRKGNGKASKRTGRKPEYDPKKDAELFGRWEAARDAGTPKEVFADDDGFPLEEVEKALSRHRKRQT